MSDLPPLLHLDQATVQRGECVVLDSLSLSIPLGQHTALLGPNGSGKTSLIKLLTRELWPLRPDDDGPAVTILGHERWNVFELRQMLGLVSPELDRDFIHERLLGWEAVVSGFFASHGLWHHQVTAEMERAADAAMARLGVAQLAQRRLNTLSTGEVRRLLIARALVHHPRALLLDEPTTGLDLVARRDFLHGLRELTATTTVLLVTHHVEEIIPEIDRVVLLRDGHVAADGPKAEVLTDQRLSAVFGAGVTVHRRDGWYTGEVVG